jgi:methionine sulfoxide reductase heme-binding subunit
MLTVVQRYSYFYKPLVFVAGLLPAAWLLAGLISWRVDLGADPIEVLLETCGKTALIFLLITLTVTPLRHLTGWTHVLRLRRMLGLYAFFYALLHFCVYLILDQQLDLSAVWQDISKRPYITVGAFALLLLLPLAITSTNGMMRRLKHRWQKLHRLIYLISILTVIHYYWQVKLDVTEPLWYAAALGVLLGHRVLRQWRVTSKSVPATTPGKT